MIRVWIVKKCSRYLLRIHTDGDESLQTVPSELARWAKLLKKFPHPDSEFKRPEDAVATIEIGEEGNFISFYCAESRNPLWTQPLANALMISSEQLMGDILTRKLITEADIAKRDFVIMTGQFI